MFRPRASGDQSSEKDGLAVGSANGGLRSNGIDPRGTNDVAIVGNGDWNPFTFRP